MEKSRKPKIRFKGFTDDWEQRKLGELVQFSKGNGYSKRDLEEVGTPIILYGRLYTNYETVISDVDTYVCAKSGSVYSRGGEVIVPASGETSEDISIASVVEKPGFLLGGDLNIITPSIQLDSVFLAISISNGKPHNVMAKMAQGKSVVHLHNSDLEKIDLLFPEHDEQARISSCIRGIDYLITLHQRKLEKLMNVKKSMLEKMFPKRGSDVPEIRFFGFTDAWEQRKFRELYSKSGEKNDGSIGINKNITVATMQFKGDVKVSTPEYLKTYYTFNLGDIAFEGHQSKEFRYGRFVENDIGNGIVSHIFSVFRPVQEYDLHFWKYAINNEELMQNILSRSTKASTMMHDLVTDDFLNETFLVPSLSEQEKVGSILHNLDNLITLHQRKLEKLKNIKKSMLEKMFI